MEIKNELVKILVVDDEENLREICADALQEEGYQVFMAGDGKEALSLIAKNEIDIVISDLRMPEMGGLELLEKIRENDLDIDFLIMTGFATIETAVECMNKGAVDYLPKPFKLDHLLVKLRKAVRDRAIRLEQKKLSDITRLLNLSNALNSQLDLESICREFVQQTMRNFSPDSVILLLLDEDRGSLQKYMVRGRLFREDPEMLKKVGKLAEKSLDESVSYLLDSRNIAGMPMFSDHFFPYCMMLVPLYSQLKKVGVIVLLRDEGLPFTSNELQLLSIFAAHVATAIQNAKIYSRIKDQNIEVIHSYAKAVEVKDYYTKGHSERVALYGMKLGRRLKLSSEEIDDLFTAGVLHDIGKIGIPDHILNKPSRLDEQEFEIMKEHPAIARDIILHVRALKSIIPVIYHHHERVDGKGYPDGIVDEQIPFLSKIISVVDAFEAMTSDRSYRKALPWEKARDTLLDGMGKQWDRELVENWVSLVADEGFENIQKGS